MRKLHLLLFLILLTGIVLAFYASFKPAKVTAPLEPESASVNDGVNVPDNIDTATPNDELYMGENGVNIRKSGDSVLILNNSDSSIGYEIFPTDKLPVIEWAPCASFVGCESVATNEFIEVPISNYSEGTDSITVFWWSQINVPDTDSFTIGQIYSQEVKL